jgi:hypothetical protein
MLNIVPEAIFPPATCVLTGSPSGPFVDTGRAVRGYGRVYISVSYLLSVAPDLGLVPAPELAKALEDQDALVQRVQALEEEMDGDVNGRVAQALEEVAAGLRGELIDVDTPEG